jgi:hypothetical protein
VIHVLPHLKVDMSRFLAGKGMHVSSTCCTSLFALVDSTPALKQQELVSITPPRFLSNPRWAMWPG